MSKKITELDFIEDIDDSALFLTRPNGSMDDKKITARSLLNSIGNPNVKGFSANIVEPNVLELVPVNDGFNIESYIEGMTISFISPIASTDEIYLKFEGLGNRKLSILNSIELCVIKENEYIEAIFHIGDDPLGEFKRTNLVENTIITNEYNAEASINISNTITTYKLTSAIGTPKTQYYKGMSVLFTSPIESKGSIVINIDDLGDKTLAEPVGDVVPFKLYENQAVIAIYNGSYFNKHIFSPVEPFDPDDTIVNIYVGPGETYTNIYTAIKECISQYGSDGGGRSVYIILTESFVWLEQLTIVNKNLDWIFIVGNTVSPTKVIVNSAVYDKPIFILTSSSINITGNFEIDLDDFSTSGISSFFKIKDGSKLYINKSRINYKDTNNTKSVRFCTITNFYTDNDTDLYNVKGSLPNTVVLNEVVITRPDVNNSSVGLVADINMSGCNITIHNCKLINSKINNWAYFSDKSTNTHTHISSTSIIDNTIGSVEVPTISIKSSVWNSLTLTNVKMSVKYGITVVQLEGFGYSYINGFDVISPSGSKILNVIRGHVVKLLTYNFSGGSDSIYSRNPGSIIYIMGTNISGHIADRSQNIVLIE